jgi:hypothetical protein
LGAVSNRSREATEVDPEKGDAGKDEFKALASCALAPLQIRIVQETSARRDKVLAISWETKM